MTLKDQRSAALKAANEIVALAKSEDRDLTDEEMATVEAKSVEVKELTEKIERVEKSAALVASLASAPSGSDEPEGPPEGEAKASGVAERFVKSDAFAAFRKSNPEGSSPGRGTPIHIEAKGLAGIDELVGKKG